MNFYKYKENILLGFNKDIDLEVACENATDASFEKHVPCYEIDGNIINVWVGDVPHPMEDNHYILWIALKSEDTFNIIKLYPGKDAKCIFPYIKNSTIYAYCNLHGLWKKDVV